MELRRSRFTDVLWFVFGNMWSNDKFYPLLRLFSYRKGDFCPCSVEPHSRVTGGVVSKLIGGQNLMIITANGLCSKKFYSQIMKFVSFLQTTAEDKKIIINVIVSYIITLYFRYQCLNIGVFEKINHF